METVEIPRYFLCPISLQMMRDPVTVCSGMTYDRESIETWIFTGNNKTCPITRQPLVVSGDADLTPNHTLRRLIQAWCTVNAASGVERIPTPKPPVHQSELLILLEKAKDPGSRLGSLRKLKALAAESDRNRRCLEAAGAVDVLASILKNNYPLAVATKEEEDTETGSAFDEALSLLHSLRISDEGIRGLAVDHGENINSLVQIMRRSGDESRAYAAFLIKSILKTLQSSKLLGLRTELFRETVRLLRDQVSSQATKAALEILALGCPWGRNRIRAAESGAVHVLVEFLLQTQDTRACEMALQALDQACRCAQGGADFLSHSAGISVVTEKMMRVSAAASERAVRILHSVAMFSASSAALNEMLQVGAVSKLCLLLQLDCGGKTKEKAKEILFKHSRVWKNSPCAPAVIQAK